ncbi:uncharacterized protein N7518_005612 [Penicillium psychrosexuale]|uniref:uncharacterized protein n=1 Tax=Penicillium psychrosexuale TaxID=1002107 RepID=UPI002544F42C|nr:uncharacterized protein N7518_005612 [Penicillium psychrosexuale]KAJ5797072.1 hypothetical protein N7518_005612 [Penicillium psychrosexuale]
MKCQVGFLRTENCINVLLSRAQHGMYLIGNSETYLNVPMWAEVHAQLPYAAPATQKYLSSVLSLKNLRERALKVGVIFHVPIVWSYVATNARQNAIYLSYITVLYAVSLVLEFERPVTMHALSSVV